MTRQWTDKVTQLKLTDEATLISFPSFAVFFPLGHIITSGGVGRSRWLIALSKMHRRDWRGLFFFFFVLESTTTTKRQRYLQTQHQHQSHSREGNKRFPPALYCVLTGRSPTATLTALNKQEKKKRLAKQRKWFNSSRKFTDVVRRWKRHQPEETLTGLTTVSYLRF